MVVSNPSNIRWLTGFGGSLGWVVVAPERTTLVTDGRYEARRRDRHRRRRHRRRCRRRAHPGRRHGAPRRRGHPFRTGARRGGAPHPRHLARPRRRSRPRAVRPGGAGVAPRQGRRRGGAHGAGRIDRRPSARRHRTAPRPGPDRSRRPRRPRVAHASPRCRRTELRHHRGERPGVRRPPAPRDGAAHDRRGRHRHRRRRCPRRRLSLRHDPRRSWWGSPRPSNSTSTPASARPRRPGWPRSAPASRPPTSMRRVARCSAPPAARTGISTAPDTGSGSTSTRSRSPRRVSTATLLEGDVVTVEPGLYRDGFGGVRIEDLVSVTATGCAPLTHLPKDAPCLPSPPTT